MIDCIVIGAGVIGATVARVLRAGGLDVTLIDDRRPFSGTTPSGGHLNTAWFKEMPKLEWQASLELLSDVWGDAFREETYEQRPDGKTFTMCRLDTDVVAAEPHTQGTVVGIKPHEKYPVVTANIDDATLDLRCRRLVVAAGVWCPTLLPGLKVEAKRGVSFRVGASLPRRFVYKWAPYKHIVAHRQSRGEVWIGDGSALLPGNWTTTRTAECLARCLAQLGGAGDVRRTLLGDRPYARPEDVKHPCLYRAASRSCTVATGAGKLGTIAAGWVAGKLRGELCGE